MGLRLCIHASCLIAGIVASHVNKLRKLGAPCHGALAIVTFVAHVRSLPEDVHPTAYTAAVLVHMMALLQPLRTVLTDTPTLLGSSRSW